MNVFLMTKIICDRSIDFTIELSQIWGQKRVKREEGNTALLIVQEKSSWESDILLLWRKKSFTLVFPSDLLLQRERERENWKREQMNVLRMKRNEEESDALLPLISSSFTSGFPSIFWMGTWRTRLPDLVYGFLLFFHDYCCCFLSFCWTSLFSCLWSYSVMSFIPFSSYFLFLLLLLLVLPSLLSLLSPSSKFKFRVTCVLFHLSLPLLDLLAWFDEPEKPWQRRKGRRSKKSIPLFLSFWTFFLFSLYSFLLFSLSPAKVRQEGQACFQVRSWKSLENWVTLSIRSSSSCFLLLIQDVDSVNELTCLESSQGQQHTHSLSSISADFLFLRRQEVEEVEEGGGGWTRRVKREVQQTSFLHRWLLSSVSCSLYFFACLFACLATRLRHHPVDHRGREWRVHRHLSHSVSHSLTGDLLKKAEINLPVNRGIRADLLVVSPPSLLCFSSLFSLSPVPSPEECIQDKDEESFLSLPSLLHVTTHDLFSQSVFAPSSQGSFPLFHDLLFVRCLFL